MAHLEEKLHTAYLSISPTDINHATSGNNNNSIQYTFDRSNELRRVKAVQLHYARLPNVFYNVSANYNYFKIKLYDSVTQTWGSTTTVQVEEGQYDLSTLVSALQTSIDAAFGANTFVSLTLGPTSKKLSLVLSTDFKLLTDDSPLSTYLLGFEDQIKEIQSTNNALTAQSFPQLQGVKNIYVYCTQFSGKSYDFGQGNRPTIGVIPCNVNFGEIITYSAGHSTEGLIEYITPRYIADATISFHDEHGDLLNIGKSEYNIILKIFFGTEM
jgi:hypothetical protein